MYIRDLHAKHTILCCYFYTAYNGYLCVYMDFFSDPKWICLLCDTYEMFVADSVGENAGTF